MSVELYSRELQNDPFASLQLNLKEIQNSAHYENTAALKVSWRWQNVKKEKKKKPMRDVFINYLTLRSRICFVCSARERQNMKITPENTIQNS